MGFQPYNGITETQQQAFLFSEPRTARGETLEIRPLDGYFAEQFELNDSAEAMPYWQVWDRTAARLLQEQGLLPAAEPPADGAAEGNGRLKGEGTDAGAH